MDDDLLKKLIGKMMPLLDERNRRLFLGILADCLGRGSVTKLNQITKVSRVTIAQGQKESIELSINPEARPSIIDAVGGTRTPGGGRKKLEEKFPNIKEELLKLLDGNTIGNPENPLCWTTKSVRNLANELEKVGIKIHYTSIGNILEEMGFSLQQNKYGQLYKYQYKEDVMERIGWYFHLYGYKQNKIMIPNLKSRRRFNYLKTIQANLNTAGIPKQFAQKLSEIFDSGVTVWHVDNGITIKDYSYDNEEV